MNMLGFTLTLTTLIALAYYLWLKTPSGKKWLKDL